MSLSVLTQIDLDMARPNAAVVHASQREASARQIEIHLKNNGVAWPVPVGIYPIVRYTKSDRIGGFYDADEDNVYAITYGTTRDILYVNLAYQALTTAGNVSMKLAFYDGDGHMAASFAWKLVVEPTPVVDEDITSSPYYNVLTKLLSDIIAYADDAAVDYAGYLSDLQTAYNSYDTQMQAAVAAAEQAKQYAQTFTGAPRTMATAAGFANADHDLIYVFTGTTDSSYTNGHWYYWNGTAWTDGGVYNSTALTTDPTLSIAGAAADASACGDLKSAFGETILFPTYDSDWNGVNNNVTIQKRGNVFSFSGNHNGQYRYISLTSAQLYASDGNERKTIPSDAFTLGENLTTGHTYQVEVKILNPATGFYYDYCRVCKYISSSSDASPICENLVPSNVKGTITKQSFVYDGSDIALLIRLKSGDISGLKLLVRFEDLGDLSVDSTVFTIDNSVLKPIEYPHLTNTMELMFYSNALPNHKQVSSLTPLPENTIDGKIRHNGAGYGSYSAIVFYDENKTAIGNGTNSSLPQGSILEHNVPQNAKFFRLSIFESVSSLYAFRATFKLTEYEQIKYLSKLLNHEFDYEIFDLLEGQKWYFHYEISTSDGSITYSSNSNYSMTDMLKIPSDIDKSCPIGSYGYTAVGRCRVAFYDENQAFISGINDNRNNLQGYEIPSTAEYIRFGTHITVPPNQCKGLLFRSITSVNNSDAIIKILRDALVMD